MDVYGNRTSFIYDSYGRQIATEDPYGHYTTTVYDSYGRVQATVDVFGHATTTTYDAYGRVQATVDALGNRTSFAYDSYGEQNSTQTSLGYTTTVYDSYGRVQATEDPLGNFSTTVYDSIGRVQATVDALGNRTSFVFDSLGRPSATENALGNYTTTLYDSYGRVSATEDARGHYTSTIYDSFGRVSATENQLGNYTSTIYDSLGRVSATENALGQFTTTLYDSMGRVAGTEDGRGNTTSTIYDSYGRVAATENPLGQFTSTIYDSLGRVAATQNGNGGLTSTLYDGFGRPAGTEDPLGHIATTLYDSYGRQDGTQDPLGHITTSVLDSFGRQVNVIDASNNKTTFVYDADNRAINQVSPTGGVSTMVYDGDGHLTSQTSPTGTQITYAYDGIGENTGQTWYNADGTVNARLTFSYDGNGNQLTAQNSVGTYTMAYDAANEVTSVQGLWGTVLSFTYDAGGNRSVTQDNFGGVTSYTHDANANLTQEQFGGTNQTAMRIDLGYDKNNQLTSETRYSDLAGNTKVATTSMAYDGDGNRLNQFDLNGSGGNIANYTWTYDAADRLTTEKLNGGATVSYTYDNANELTGDGVTSPTYDATGNRSGAGYTVSTGNELTVDPNDTYSYDASGEETKAVIKSSGNAWVYTYDPKGEVTKAQLLQYDPAIHGTGDPVLQEVDYKYDALGNMVERDYPTGTGSPVTRYAMDGWDPALAGATGPSNFNVWAELDGNNSNALLTRYFHGDQVDQLFGRQDSLVQYWTLTDRLGSVRDVVDNSGNVKDAINYDGWGNIVSETNSTYRGNYAWTGRQFDVETDLQYNRARWYDPATGRWQTQDPQGFDANDSNLYRYVHNQPLVAADPSGSVTVRIAGDGTLTYPDKLSVQDGRIQLMSGDPLTKEVFYQPSVGKVPLTAASATFSFLQQNKGQFKFQQNQPFVIPFRVEAGFGVVMTADFQEAKQPAGAPSKRYYWVQYYMQDDAIISHTQFLPPNRTNPNLQWFVDGVDLRDPQIPNAYSPQSFVTDHPFFDFPHFGFILNLAGGQNMTINKNNTITVSLAGSAQSQIDTTCFIMRLQGIKAQVFTREYELYLVKQGAGNQPLGYLDYGFTFRISQSTHYLTNYGPTWHANQVDKKVWNKAKYPAPPNN